MLHKCTFKLLYRSWPNNPYNNLHTALSACLYVRRGLRRLSVVGRFLILGRDEQFNTETGDEPFNSPVFLLFQVDFSRFKTKKKKLQTEIIWGCSPSCSTPSPGLTAMRNVFCKLFSICTQSHYIKYMAALKRLNFYLYSMALYLMHKLQHELVKEVFDNLLIFITHDSFKLQILFIKMFSVC